MNLKSKIKMFEEFTSDIETSVKSTNTKQTTKPSEKIRGEVLADVDAILTNLETLSAQITEQHNILLEEFEITATSILENTEMINEDFMAEIMKQVKSMKAYAKLAAIYPKMKKNILKAELEKTDKLGEFEASKIERSDEYMDQLKNAYKEKIDQVSASDAPAIKKTQQKEALRQARDQAIEKGAATVGNKLEAAKAKLTKQLDDKIRDLGTKLDELTSNNKIEADLLQKQWKIQELKINDKIEADKAEKELEIKNKYAEDNPEQVEKNNALYKKQIAKQKAESAAKSKEKAEELAEIQAQFDAEKDKGTEEEKDAKKAISDWFTAGNAYANYLGTVDFGIEESIVTEAEVEIPDEVKAKIKELRKAYNDANASVTISTFKKAGSNQDDAEEQFSTFKEMINSAVAEYDDQVNTIEGLDKDDNEGGEAKSANDVATEALGDSKDEYTKVTQEQIDNDTIDVPPAEEGGEPTTKPKWTDVKKFKGKDDKGADTDEEVIYAKEDSSESVATVKGIRLDESMSVAEKFKALMYR